MVPPRLITERFTIRPLEHKDLKAFAEYRAHAEIAKYQSWTSYTYDEAVELFDNMDYATFGAEGQWYQLAIALNGSDQLVGDIAIHFIDQHQIEVGFTVSSAYQGKSVATEAVSRVLHYAFSELNIHRITATTDANNVASYRLLEKLGFRREGHFIQNILFKGAWRDEYLYALLNSEQSTILGAEQVKKT